METPSSSFLSERNGHGPRNRVTVALFSIVLALLLPVLPADAASTEAVNQTFSFARTNWSDSVSLSLFDGSLGALQSVAFELSATVGGNLLYESLDLVPQTITMRLQAQIRIGAPGGLTGVTDLISVAPLVEIIEGATAADGVIDFNGGSGSTFLGLLENDQTNTNYDASNPLWEFSIREFFTTDTPGSTVALPVTAISQSSGSGADTLATILQTSAGGELTVTYFYETIPEPASMAFIASALLALGLRRRR